MINKIHFASIEEAEEFMSHGLGLDTQDLLESAIYINNERNKKNNHEIEIIEKSLNLLRERSAEYARQSRLLAQFSIALDSMNNAPQKNNSDKQTCATREAIEKAIELRKLAKKQSEYATLVIKEATP